MSLFDANGVILIAVDDKFTLDDRDGLMVNRNSIVGQFLRKYYTEESGYKDVIKKAVDNRNNATEVSVVIGDKIFVLFAYSWQGKREDYANDRAYERGFLTLNDSLRKVFEYCSKHYPGETVHTALLGTGIHNFYLEGKGVTLSDCDAKKTIETVASEVGVAVKIMERDETRS